MGVTVKILSGGRENSENSNADNNESIAEREVISEKPVVVKNASEKSETAEKIPLFTVPVKASPRRLGFGAVITVQLILSALCFGALWIFSLTGGEEASEFIGRLIGMMG